MKNKIFLASGSPRRKMLLEWAELDFEVVVSDADESFDQGLSPDQIALQIAEKKNNVVSEKIFNKDSSAIIISADTIVVLDDEIIGKPTDADDAISILMKLNGRSHRVITAVVLKTMKQTISFTDITTVSFNELTEDQIKHYVSAYRPFDKAGAYAIQEWIGVVGIQKIEGDFYNVMGLPISRVVKSLQLLIDSF